MIEPKTRRTIGPQLSTDNRLLSLGDQIRAFAKKTGETMDQVHRNVSIKLFNSIVMDTPVKEGEARGGWIPSVGAPILATTGNLDTTGAEVRKQIELTLKNATYEDVVFFSNNVEHIVPLEYGWSRQSPEGMVRINVSRFRRMLNEAVQESKT